VAENQDSLVSIAIPPLAGEFLYRDSPQHPVAVGDLVSVPFGNRYTRGFAVSVDSARENEIFSNMIERGIDLRTIPANHDNHAAFLPEQLPYFEWIAKYYGEPLSKILDLAIPPVNRSKPIPHYVIDRDPLNADKLTRQQREIIEFISSLREPIALSTLKERFKNIGPKLRILSEKGLVRETVRSADGSSSTIRNNAVPELPDPSPDQAVATAKILESLATQSFHSYMLHGVTGSGKTEVYLQVIAAALRKGLGAILIVPEISLTPQMVDRFQNRLGEPVSVLHSNLSPKARWDNWADLLQGKTRVALGARSAIFAPVRDLGVIVVDEEHDASFKQNDGIRYHGRDLALVRGKLAKCPVVLGSATPSLETFHQAQTGKHTLLTLNDRFFSTKRLNYKIIDLSKIKAREMPSKNISPEFLQLLSDTLHRNEQAFVMYNRRGFATYLQCTQCEHVLECPDCSITLTYHRQAHELLCHLCGFSTERPLLCPGCRESKVSHGDQYEITTSGGIFCERGAGTERVLEELEQLLPTARIAKLDRDTARSLDDYNKILQGMHTKSYDILVGTQMIAKGHDLPDVTFVGMIDCDIGLHFPDFRAGERTFQLLTQAAGRAGRRDKPGYVVLQTRIPKHPSLQMTVGENFKEFAAIELKIREALLFPPFQRLLRVIVSAEERSVARSACMHLADLAAKLTKSSNIQVRGPSPAPLEKVRRHWRYHLLFKCSSAGLLHQCMLRLRESIPKSKQVRVVFDLDPQDML